MKEVKKSFYVGRMLISFIIATFLFIGVFAFGYFVAFEGLLRLDSRKDFFSTSLFEIQLQRELIGSSCDVDFGRFNDDLNNMVSLMGKLEEQLGKNNPEVIEQKKSLVVLQIQHYLLVEERNEQCSVKNPIILFFYSNEEGFLDEGERMGYILQNLKNSRPEIMIYAFDFNLDSELVRTLISIKDVERPNVIVIEDELLYNVRNVNELSNVVDETLFVADFFNGNEPIVLN